MLGKHKNAVTTFELRPSRGGIFELSVNGKLVFSKRALGRFPNEGEAEALIDQAMGV